MKVIASAQKQNVVQECNNICPETECMWTCAYSAYFSVCHAWVFRKMSVGIGFLHHIRPSGRIPHKMLGIGKKKLKDVNFLYGRMLSSYPKVSCHDSGHP